MKQLALFALCVLPILHTAAGAEDVPYFRWGADPSMPASVEPPLALPANAPQFAVTAAAPVSSSGHAVAGVPLSTQMLATSGTTKSWSLEGNPAWLGVGRTTGIVSGTPPLGTSGFSFMGIGKDAYGRTASTNVVSVTTEQPSGSIGTVTRNAVEGGFIAGKLSSNIPGATWALALGPSWMAVSSDGTVTGLPPDVATTTSYPFRAVASAGGISATLDDAIVTAAGTVSLSGVPTSLVSSASMVGQATTTLGSGVAWSLIGAPPWMGIDPVSGQLSGTPTSTAANVKVRATRNGALADSAAFSVAYTPPVTAAGKIPMSYNTDTSRAFIKEMYNGHSSASYFFYGYPSYTTMVFDEPVLADTLCVDMAGYGGSSGATSIALNVGAGPGGFGTIEGATSFNFPPGYRVLRFPATTAKEFFMQNGKPGNYTVFRMALGYGGTCPTLP